MAAGGAAWEARVVHDVEESVQLRLVRRCVDIADLIAVARTGSAEVALVAPDLPGLDVDAVDELRRARIEVVAVGDESSASSAAALGISRRILPQEVVSLTVPVAPVPGVPRPEGRSWAVWGPAGAPGRSTVALSMAAAAAARGHETVLVDADTYGGSIGQLLAILDDVSGLMAACRVANHGRVHEVEEQLLEVEPGLRVLTGLPRADLWPQVRRSAFELVLRRVRGIAPVSVVDCGFSLESAESASGRGRNQATELALTEADEVVVVGRADPVGLARLVRGLHELAEVTGRTDPLVVVNQMRPGLGWREADVRETLTRLAGIEPHLFLPWDQTSLDAAAMSGRLPRLAAPSSPFVARVESMVGSLLG